VDEGDAILEVGPDVRDQRNTGSLLQVVVDPGSVVL